MTFLQPALLALPLARSPDQAGTKTVRTKSADERVDWMFVGKSATHGADGTLPPHPGPFASRRCASPMGEGADGAPRRCAKVAFGTTSASSAGSIFVSWKRVMRPGCASCFYQTGFCPAARQRLHLPLPRGEGWGEGEDHRSVLHCRIPRSRIPSSTSIAITGRHRSPASASRLVSSRARSHPKQRTSPSAPRDS